MNLGLANKVVVVSGGGAGIGAAITQTLLEEGAKVAVLARSKIDADVKEAFSRLGTFAVFETELTDEAQCQTAIRNVLAQFGRIDGLINNAGVNDNQGIEDGVSAFRQSLEKSLIHYFTLMHYCLPELQKNRGSVVNIGSKTAWTGQGHTSGYAAANGGRMALTREWAAALLADGVRVNAVIPAEVMTPLYQRWLENFTNPAERLAEITANIPLGKRMTTG